MLNQCRDNYKRVFACRDRVTDDHRKQTIFLDELIFAIGKPKFPKTHAFEAFARLQKLNERIIAVSRPRDNHLIIVQLKCVPNARVI